MDIDSPSNKTQDEADDDDVEEEPSYNAELLELEPLREDSDDLLDDNDDDNDGKAQGSHSEDDDEDDDGKTSEPHEGSSTSSEEDDDDDEDEEDAHVQGLTSNEREILTLLAVDKKLASLLELAANALSALRPKEKNDKVQSVDVESAGVEPKSDKPMSPSQAFEKAASEYYKALDDIQLTLRNSIHVIRKSRISPRTLMENPALGSVLASGSGSSITSADPSTAVNIAPGVVPSKSGGLGRGAQRMELETYKEGIRALKNFLESLDQPAHQNGQNDARQGSSNGL